MLVCGVAFKGTGRVVWRSLCMMEAESRAFPNTFPAYEEREAHGLYNRVTDKISEEWKAELSVKNDGHLRKLEAGLKGGIDWRDSSVYTGTAGIALLYFHMANVDPAKSDAYLRTALSYVEPVLDSLKGRRLSFLCGDPGPLAVAAVLYHKLNLKEKCDALLKKLQKWHKSAVDLHSDVPDELLYGRAGYLYSLLFVQKHIHSACIDQGILRVVVEAMLKNGQMLARKERWESPLMYVWHDSYYLGAAHGVSGILYMLMQVFDILTDDEKLNIVKPSIDFLMGLRYPSGNYPSSIGSKTDKLVHWCHGAPGFIYMFAAAYKVYGDSKYLQEALSCGEVIWERGLLKKGYGICHGVAGNAYGFLLLYNITGDEKHLYRAAKFAEWCNYGTETRHCNTPDRPLSLFEGLAGTVYYLASLQNPKTAAFPAFQL